MIRRKTGRTGRGSENRHTKRRNGVSGILSLILIISILLSACGSGITVPTKAETKAPGTSAASVSAPSGTEASAPSGKTEETEAVLSPERTSVTTEDGITVDVGEYVLDGEAVLSVSRLESEDHPKDGYRIDVYDIQLGDLHELGDFITIRFPYDTSYCEAGQDPAKCVGAKYKNEKTGEWEDVLFEVDPGKQELVIYTDHLSCFGIFYVSNEGRRNAEITDILSDGLYMSKEQTMAFASRIAADDSSVKKDLSDYAEKVSETMFDWADRLDNAINVATLGGVDVPEWLSTEIPETNQTLFSALGYIATATNLMKLALKDASGKSVTDGEVLNLIRDVASKVTTYWAGKFTSLGAEALSVGMAGVLIIDKMLTAFAEEAQATRLEDIQYVYHHYNEGFSAPWAHKLMTPKDWREKVIEVIEKHPDDPETAISALEAGFRKYASEFFALTGDQMAEVAAAVPNVTVKRIPNFTDEEKAQMIGEYVAYLKDKVMPAVLKSVQSYMVKKSEQAELAAMNSIKDFYNTKITIKMEEDLPENGKSQYVGYKLRFAPLKEGADKTSWSGKWPESGGITTSTTLIGLMSAGFPHTVEFFASDANMDKDKPEFTVPFVISIPMITVKLGGASTVKDWDGNFAGTALPGPMTAGKITEWTVKSDSVTIRVDGMTYQEYIAYCRTLEALDGWKVYEGDYPEDTAHFPADYNDRAKVYFTGSYGTLPRISVQYYSDKTCEGNGLPHFCMFVFFEW